MSIPGCPPVGVWFFPDEPAGGLVDAFVEAEAHGLDEVWIGDEGPAYRDPIAVLAAAAAVTTRVRLGVAVTNPYLRHPAVTASSLMTVHELSDGRAVLGYGPGGAMALDPVGIARTRPLSRTREAVKIAREVAPGLPVFVGSRGEGFNRFASEEADGAFIGGIPFPLVNAAIGWARSVRPLPVALYPTVVLDEEDLEKSRPYLIFPLLDSPLSTREITGLSRDEVAEAVAALDAGEEGPARRIVSDEVLSHLALSGSPAQIAARLAGMVRTHRADSIGLCVQSTRPVASRMPVLQEIFATLGRELL